jgi:cytochrome c oxidase subunit 2
MTSWNQRVIGSAALVLGMAASTMAWAQGNAEQGKTHYQLCVACHGANAEGNQILNAPATAGQHAGYISRQLYNFRNGLRGADPNDTVGVQMRGMAVSLPGDQAVEDVAAYISTLAQTTAPAGGGGDAVAGARSYEVCTACHGANGEGDAALGAPRLTGLGDWYLTRQLQNFKAGVRGSHMSDVYGTQMRTMAQTLKTDQDVANVVTYIGGLQAGR